MYDDSAAGVGAIAAIFGLVFCIVILFFAIDPNDYAAYNARRAQEAISANNVAITKQIEMTNRRQIASEERKTLYELVIVAGMVMLVVGGILVGGYKIYMRQQDKDDRMIELLLANQSQAPPQQMLPQIRVIPEQVLLGFKESPEFNVVPQRDGTYMIIDQQSKERNLITTSNRLIEG